MALVTLVGLGKFADFLMGPRGDRRLKDRLITFYVNVSDENWTAIIAIPANSYCRFLQTVFGTRPNSCRFYVAVFLYSTAIFIAVVGGTYYEHPSTMKGALSFWYPFLVFFIINYLLDLVSLMLLITILARIDWTITKKAVVSTITVLITLLVIFDLAVTLSASIFNVIAILYIGTSRLTPWHLSWMSFVWAGAVLSATHPWHSSASIGNPFDPADQINFSIFSVSVVAPLSVLAVIITCSLAMYYSRDLTRRPLLLVIERIEEAKDGVFTVISWAITGIVGIIEALRKALG